MAAEEKVFRYRLDIYWRALALYLLAFVGYGFLRSGLSDGRWSVALRDPVALLLLGFVVWTGGVLVWVWYRCPSIGIGADYVRLRSRFRERLLRLEEIERLRIPSRWRGGGFVRIRLKGRRGVVVVRPAAYERSHELLQEFVRLSRLVRAA